MSNIHLKRFFREAVFLTLICNFFLTPLRAEPSPKEVPRQESSAVAVARAHVAAWSNHDYDKARKLLADDVNVMVTTTQPTMKDVNTTGIDDYMRGLKEFAQTVEPGSARVISSVGDDRNALIIVTAKASFGRAPMTVTAARLYLLDENAKIKSERVIFFAAAQ